MKATARVGERLSVALEARTGGRDLNLGNRLPARAEDTTLDIPGDLLGHGACGAEEQQYGENHASQDLTWP